jgi:hypothetical protein
MLLTGRQVEWSGRICFWRRKAGQYQAWIGGLRRNEREVGTAEGKKHRERKEVTGIETYGLGSGSER